MRIFYLFMIILKTESYYKLLVILDTARYHKENKQENEECMYYSQPNADSSVISD